MTYERFVSDIAGGESQTVEFKSWIHAKNMRERIRLAVDELIAFANSGGGTVFFGVEDDGSITGCTDYDTQQIMESIYDQTRPSLFTAIEIIKCPEGDVLAISVEANGTIYATSSGKCLKRLGKNSKPYFPDEMGNNYSVLQNPDFSGQIVVESTELDNMK